MTDITFNCLACHQNDHIFRVIFAAALIEHTDTTVPKPLYKLLPVKQHRRPRDCIPLHSAAKLLQLFKPRKGSSHRTVFPGIAHRADAVGFVPVLI